MCYIDSQWEAAADPGELSLVLCDDLDWWVGGGGWEEGPRGKGPSPYHSASQPHGPCLKSLGH